MVLTPGSPVGRWQCVGFLSLHNHVSPYLIMGIHNPIVSISLENSKTMLKLENEGERGYLHRLKGYPRRGFLTKQRRVALQCESLQTPAWLSKQTYSRQPSGMDRLIPCTPIWCPEKATASCLWHAHQKSTTLTMRKHQTNSKWGRTYKITTQSSAKVSRSQEDKDQGNIPN